MPDKPVLLVEDDPSDVRLIQRAFGKLEQPVQLIRLTDGDDVVDYLGGKHPYENRALHPVPALMLLDIKLPRRSGFEVLQWLRGQNSALKRLPVIMLTSSRHSADINRAYDLGANSYLAKPETAAQLQQLASEFRSYWLSFNESPDLSDGLALRGLR
jgi:CheY-like chemotaxis protein